MYCNCTVSSVKILCSKYILRFPSIWRNRFQETHDSYQTIFSLFMKYPVIKYLYTYKTIKYKIWIWILFTPKKNISPCNFSPWLDWFKDFCSIQYWIGQYLEKSSGTVRKKNKKGVKKKLFKPNFPFGPGTSNPPPPPPPSFNENMNSADRTDSLQFTGRFYESLLILTRDNLNYVLFLFN